MFWWSALGLSRAWELRGELLRKRAQANARPGATRPWQGIVITFAFRGKGGWERWHQSHKLHYPKKIAEFNSALAKERWSDAQKAEIFRRYLAEKLEHRYCTCLNTRLKISSSICSVNLPF